MYEYHQYLAPLSHMVGLSFSLSVRDVKRTFHPIQRTQHT